jgi:hypothetical protein
VTAAAPGGGADPKAAVLYGETLHPEARFDRNPSFAHHPGEYRA